MPRLVVTNNLKKKQYEYIRIYIMVVAQLKIPKVVSRDAVCGCEQHNILGACRNLRQAPFLLQRKIKTKNIGDINYGNEGHFEQNVEPRGTFS